MDILEQIHKHLGETFLAKLQAGEATPSELSTMRQFLKDNQVDSDSVTYDGAKSTQKEIKSKLPFPEDNLEIEHEDN